MVDYPLLVLLVSVITLWLSAQAGSYYHRRRGKLDDDARADLGVVLGATMTLLALVIGFSLAMATNRYDQRKSCEAAEANAISTEYLRAGLLTGAAPARVQGLLRSYLEQRKLFYTVPDLQSLQEINSTTARQQAELWDAIQTMAATQPPALVGLNVSGMNDLLNSSRSAQAAWWNRVPTAAWILLIAIAIFCNFLAGYGAHQTDARVRRFFALPLIGSIAFFLIADIDSPRRGLIRLRPQNLDSLSLVLGGQQLAGSR